MLYTSYIVSRTFQVLDRMKEDTDTAKLKKKNTPAVPTPFKTENVVSVAAARYILVWGARALCR